MIIAPVGEDEQGAFAVFCTPHLAETQIDGVQQRRSPFGRRQASCGSGGLRRCW